MLNGHFKRQTEGIANEATWTDLQRGNLNPY